MTRRIGIGGRLERAVELSAAALAVAVLAALLAATPAPASTEAKAFPPGCWIGARPFTGTFANGPAKAKVTDGKLKLVVWVGGKPAMAVGFLTFTGIGAGSLTVAGSELVLEVKIVGDYDLTGTPAAVKVNGTYSMIGSAIGSGQFAGTYPIKSKVPVKNALLTIKTVSATHVTGVFGQFGNWSATRRAGAPSKNAAACANAA
jgi:hypothetical protein